MIKNRNSFFITLSALLVCATSYAAGIVSPYGQIQNVQNYSSNPFWDPNGPYNQKMPQPVYATGPQVNATDCQNTMFKLIAAICAQDHCRGKRASDIRPAVMLDLSRMPDQNYVTACAGYMDSVFKDYLAQSDGVVTATAYPTAHTAAPQPTGIKPQNLYTPPAPPKWKQEMQERDRELKTLQAANGVGNEHLEPTAYPKTINDVSMADRMANLTAGYEPFKDAKAYAGIHVEDLGDAMTRQLNALEAQRELDFATMDDKEYCDKYPLDDTRCEQTPGLYEKVVEIGNAEKLIDISNKNARENKSKTPPNDKGKNNGTVTNGELSPTDNKTKGGKCYPSARSNWAPNKIYTSGKYENIDPAFEKAMIQIFRMEGGCGNHPADAGGYTCYGFAQNAHPDIDVRKLTRPKVEDLTYDRIYKAHNIDKLPDSIRGDALRGWFGSGYHGIAQLEKTLGLPQTKRGKITDEIARAAENYQGDLHNAYWDNMQKFYVGIAERKPSQKVFLKGWMNGVKLMRENGCHVKPAQPLTR